MRCTNYLIGLLLLSACVQSQDDNHCPMHDLPIKEYNQKLNIPVFSLDDFDSSMNQFYIDTSHSHPIYSKANSEAITDYEFSITQLVKEYDQEFKPKDLDVSVFPTHWITIRKGRDKFYLYDRCDGNDPMFWIFRNMFIFHEVHEEHFKEIVGVKKNGDRDLIFDLLDFNDSPTKDSSHLIISSIDSLDGIYLLQHNTATYQRKQYVVLKSELDEFDLIVNHCPNSKVPEFDQFDNTSWQIKAK